MKSYYVSEEFLPLDVSIKPKTHSMQPKIEP